MDQTRLIDEIVSRVAAKLAETGDVPAPCESCGASCGGAAKPGLLVLTQRHGEACHAVLESVRLQERYRTDCALLQDDCADIGGYDVVVLYQFSNEVLGKLAGGVCDTPYTRLAAQAILRGKRVYVPTEQVELYRYATTAPGAYYAMMREKLDLLIASGVTICAQGNLEQSILEGAARACAPAACPSAPAAEKTCRAERELRLEKRVLTEKDVSDALAGHFTCIRLPAKCILTALAQDCAKDRGIRLERE